MSDENEELTSTEERKGCTDHEPEECVGCKDRRGEGMSLGGNYESSVSNVYFSLSAKIKRSGLALTQLATTRRSQTRRIRY